MVIGQTQRAPQATTSSFTDKVQMPHAEKFLRMLTLFGNLAISNETHGFAPPIHSGFALVASAWSLTGRQLRAVFTPLFQPFKD